MKARTQGITWLPKLKGPSGKEVEVPEEREEVQALKAELGRTRVVKEKLKTTVTRVRKECDELKDVNMTTVKALERETKRARKEEWSRNKFRRALWGSSPFTVVALGYNPVKKFTTSTQLHKHMN